MDSPVIYIKAYSLGLDCILTCAHTALFSGVWSVFLLLQFASLAPGCCPLSLSICRWLPPCWRCVCIKNKTLEEEMDSHVFLSCMGTEGSECYPPVVSWLRALSRGNEEGLYFSTCWEMLRARGTPAFQAHLQWSHTREGEEGTSFTPWAKLGRRTRDGHPGLHGNPDDGRWGWGRAAGRPFPPAIGE